MIHRLQKQYMNPHASGTKLVKTTCMMMSLSDGILSKWSSVKSNSRGLSIYNGSY